MSELRLWQALAAALLVLWLFTAAFGYFRSQLVEGQWLTMFRSDLVSTLQQLAREQQALAQRLQALEQQTRPE